MKTLAESLFDKDLATDDITSLYNLFGKHIKKFQHTCGSGLGWTHYFDQPAVVREWKKEGRPELSGGFSKTTFPPDLQKFIAVILNNVIVIKKQLIKISGDGEIDDKSLNKKLEDADIILPEGSRWGASGSRYFIKVQMGYIEGIPPSPDHGIQFRIVGRKRFKGFNTENIELSIHTYDPKNPEYSHHIWTLLTDLSIKDLK